MSAVLFYNKCLSTEFEHNNKVNNLSQEQTLYKLYNVDTELPASLLAFGVHTFEFYILEVESASFREDIMMTTTGRIKSHFSFHASTVPCEICKRVILNIRGSKCIFNMPRLMIFPM